MGDEENEPDSGGGVIIDGLLCSILRALSRSPLATDLISVIERCVSEKEVKDSWVKLFSFYSDVMDPTRKKKVIDIDRETTKGRISDIVNQLGKVDREKDVRDVLVMPWNYVIEPFESDSEVRARIWEDEKNKDESME